MKRYITILCLLIVHISYSQSTTFDTSGSWTSPSGVTSVIVECWGGGGGGGYAATIPGNTSIAAGGGGGCYSKKMISVTPGMTYAVHVGTGGAGGNATTIDGQAGGDSWFGSVTDVLAKGSGGGSGNNAPPAVSGGSGSIPGSIGETTYMGGNGHSGEIATGRFGGMSYYSGGGGSSAEPAGNGMDGDRNNPGIATTAGGNGGDGVSNTSSAGTDGGIPGGGGGGSMVLDNGTTMSFNGGNGGNGRVIITPVTPLPIELLYFTASYTNMRTILFSWKIANRNSRNIVYSIEASSNGKQFSEIYRNKYTGQIPSEYSYHYSTGDAATYYRLKSMDEHGTVKYSSVITLNDQGNTGIRFYPNPSENISFVDYNAPLKDNISIIIYDIKGREVLSVQQSVEAGNNQLAMDIASLLKGIYFVAMFDSKGKLLFTSRLAKH